MAYANEEECTAAGLDVDQVERIAAGLSRYARQAEALGLTIFGGSGSGTLRFDDGGPGKLIICASNLALQGGEG